VIATSDDVYVMPCDVSAAETSDRHWRGRHEPVEAERYFDLKSRRVDLGLSGLGRPVEAQIVGIHGVIFDHSIVM
jgi:hypothetical protein